jgi:hypothetical protein
MNVTKLLAIIACSAGLSFLSFAQAEELEASSPNPANLSNQLKAITDMLSASNATKTLSLKQSESVKVVHGLTLAQSLLKNQAYDDALQQVTRTLESYAGSTNSALSLAMQKFVSDTSSFIAAMEESLTAEGKKIEEDAAALFPAAKHSDELIAFKAKADDYKMRAEKFYSRRNSRFNSELHSKFYSLSAMATEWARVLSGVQSGDMNKAVSTLQNMKSSYGQAKVMTTSAMLKRIAEVERMQEDMLTMAIAKLKEACIKTEATEELDKAMDAFNDIYMKNQSAIYNNRVLQSKTERIQQAAKQWSRVLAAVENENYQEALQLLNSMENDSYGSNVLFSRKELSEKKELLLKKSLKSPRKENDPLIVMINDMMNKVKSIEGLTAIKQVIQNISRSGYSQNDIQYLISDITSLEQLNEAVKNGQYGTVFQSYTYRSSEGNQHRWKAILEKLRADVRNAAIGGLCEIKDFEVGKDEIPEKVLQSYIDKAASKKQWEQVLKYLDAYRQAFASAGYSYTSWLTDESAAARNFITARNYEKAEEYERALLNYMAVLNSTSKRTPIDEAIEAIKKIKKNHPDAYEKASRLGVPATQPLSPPSDGPKAFRSGI